VPARDSAARETTPRDSSAALPIRLVLASSNPGKLREYRLLVDADATEDGLAGRPTSVLIDPLPNFSVLPPFDESFSTFAENAAGKALHYSRHADPASLVLADDSGLVVPSLNGVPGVHSARYAGPNATDKDRYEKLLREMRDKAGDPRRAHFVCVIALARAGRAVAVVSARADGHITTEPRGSDGFGYDPVFFFEELGRTYAETTREEKNLYSHRGKAFRKLLALLIAPSQIP